MKSLYVLILILEISIKWPKVTVTVLSSFWSFSGSLLGAIHLQASSEAEADSTGLGTGLFFQASLSAWYFRPIHQANSEASSGADSLEADSLEADSLEADSWYDGWDTITYVGGYTW